MLCNVVSNQEAPLTLVGSCAITAAHDFKLRIVDSLLLLSQN